MRKFWNFKTIKNEETESEERVLELYGTISDETWYGDEVTPAIFKRELGSGNGPITVYINSPGGDCIAASQIYTMLKEYEGKVTVKIDGLAASAASVIAMSGDEILMAPTSLMMIHNPSMVAMGESKDFEKAIDILKEVKDSIMTAYQLRTGLSKAVLSHMMDDETWLSASKAVELGFADGLIKGTANDIVVDSFLFSTRESTINLLNKIGEESKAEVPASEEGESVPEPTGRNIEMLRSGLTKIKKLI